MGFNTIFFFQKLLIAKLNILIKVLNYNLIRI